MGRWYKTYFNSEKGDWWEGESESVCGWGVGVGEDLETVCIYIRKAQLKTRSV